LNVCRPDHRKSCAACCGLYNVEDATRPALLRKLQNRTLRFQATDRSPDPLQEFKDHIQSVEATVPPEEAIHVCEFCGFLDAENRVVGCMLHPTAPGNGGIDLRGMCHYGSMACKSFFCPAWEDISPLRLGVLVDAVQDWHLYGLVVTDVDFVTAVFDLLEDAVGSPLVPDMLGASDAGQVFHEMLSWKDTWPYRGNAAQRRSRYYFKRTVTELQRDRASHLATLTEILRFTFDLEEATDDWREYVSLTVEKFVHAYRGC
jgi:hypothetical protein